MEKNGVKKLNIQPGCFKRMIAGAFALITVFSVAGCRNKNNNDGNYGKENSPSSFSDSHDKSSSEKEASSSRKDSSSRESSHINSEKDGDYVLEDDGLDHHPDITPDDYIAVVTDGPIVSTDERISTTTTVKGGRTSSSSSSVDNSNEKNNSGTSTKRGGGGVGIASVGDGKNNKNPRESTPVNTTARVKVTTTAPVTTTTTTTTTVTTTSEPAPIVTEPYNQIAEVPNEYSYNINDIANPSALASIAGNLHTELMSNYGGDPMHFENVGYGMTNFGLETKAFVAYLNAPYTSDESLERALGGFGDTDYEYAESFMLGYRKIKEALGCDMNSIDLSNYMVDQEAAAVLNNINREFYAGNYSNYMSECFNNGSLNYVINNPAAMAIICSYDQDEFFDFYEVKYNFKNFANDLRTRVNGNTK